MTPKAKTLIHTSFVFVCCAILTIAWIVPVKAEPTAIPNPETTLVRVEVQEEHGQTVRISVPLGLLDTLYAVMPNEIHEACEELDLTPEFILKELATLEGEDIVRITGEDEVRVWLENTTPENQKDNNFVTVFVKEGENNDNEVHVKVPKGLVKLAARVIKELGIVEECIDLPPEVRKALNKVKAKEKAEKSE